LILLCHFGVGQHNIAAK